MFKKSRFRRPFDKQHGKRPQALLKSASHHLYHIHWSMPSQSSVKKSLLLTRKILGLLVNTSSTDEKYPVLNRDNLTTPIQMDLSQKPKSFLSIFCFIFEISAKFWTLLKKTKMTVIAFVFPKLRTPKTWLDKCLKSPVWEDSSISKIINVPKHCWNLHHSTIIIITDHCQVNCVAKNLSDWHVKSWSAC